MRWTLLICCPAVWLGIQANGRAGEPATPEPAKVLIVGTFHMAKPGLDMFNPSVKDVLGERRQREIADVVGRLARFKPTKVALEYPPDSRKPPERYAAFKAGKYTLTADEQDQLGFRIARDSAHEKVYGIDFRQDMDFDKVTKFAQSRGQGRVIQDLMARFQSAVGPMLADDYMERHSIGEILIGYNAPEFDRLGHSLYMGLLRVGVGAECPGTDLVVGWYDRNLRMATNVVRLADRPGERILVLVGSGHAKLLREFLGQTPGIEVVDAGTYLK